MSIYSPLQIVKSSLICRNKHNRNLKENEMGKTEKVDENDYFWKRLDHQTQKIIKNDINELKINKQIFNKRRNTDIKFNDIKKRFKTETRIYQNSMAADNLSNSGFFRNLNNGNCMQLHMSSSDKYLSTIDTVKDLTNNVGSNISKCTLLNRNWVPGQMVTKIENGSACKDNLNDSLENNQNLLERCCAKDKEQNTAFYSFSHKAPLKKGNRKKGFIEQFNEFKIKHETTTKPKEKMENNYSTSFISKKPECDKSSRISVITPFKGFKTSFFADVNPAEKTKSKEGSFRCPDNTKTNITLDWVKGGVIQREENITNNLHEATRRRTPDSKHLALNYFNPKNNIYLFENRIPQTYSDSIKDPSPIASRRTSVMDEEDLAPRNCNIIQNQCTSTMTISNSVQYSREIVIRKIQVSKVTFPPHLFH